MEFLYKNDPSCLLTKSRTGTKERTYTNKKGTVIVCPAKAAMTPEKVKLLKDYMTNRIKSQDMTPAEESARLNARRIDQMFATSLNYFQRNIQNHIV